MILQEPFSTDILRTVPDGGFFRKLTIVFGVLAVLTCITGITGNVTGITLISSVCEGCKTLALSAALIWIFFGAVLVYVSIQQAGRTACLLVRGALVVIACMELLEIVVKMTGGDSVTESWFVAAGSALFGPLSSPISPVASGFIVIAAIGLFFCIDPAFLSPQNRRAREITALAGIIVVLCSFTLVLSYFFGNPFFYGTPIIPVAAISALAAFFIGAGLIAVAGPATVPACYFMGTSTGALLLRNFVFLTVAITLCENILFYLISSWYHISDAVMISFGLVIFTIVAAVIVGRLSGTIGKDLDEAERALVHKNEDLNEINEELQAAQEELRQNLDELTSKEQALQESEERITQHINNSPLAVIGFSADFRITLWSEEACRMFGWTKEEVLGKAIGDLRWVFEEDMERVAAISADMLSGRKPRNMHSNRNYRKDGTVIDCEWYNSAIRDARGNLISIQSQILDVTARNKAEKALKESEERLRLAHEKLKKESGKLDILAESARLLLSAEKPEHIVQTVGERVMRYLHCHTFFNYLIDESGQRMRLNAWAGIPPEEAGKIEYLNLGEAVCGQVARDGERIVVSDVLNAEDARTRLIRSFGVSGYVCHPLISQGRTLGTLSFGSCDHAQFTDEELDLMRAVTDLVATAMARKKIEDTLRGTSQYLENLIDYANAPIIVWDPAFRIQRFNRASEFLTGMPADTVLGKSLDLLFPEKTRRESMELIQKTGSGERWESVEIPIRHVSGAMKIVLWNSAHLYDPDGVTISSTIAQGQDITERKTAEEAAMKGSSLLTAALDSTADGIVVVDNDGNITSYNKKFCTIWGIPADMLDGAGEKTALAYMTPLVADPGVFASRLQDLYAHPERESYDTVSLMDGRIFERYSKPQKIGATIVGRVWSYRDITERRRAEEALQESLEKFRIIATNTPDHISVQDKDLRYVQVINPPLGLKEQDMIGKTDFEILSGENAENLATIKRHVLESGTAVHREIPFENASGEKNYFDGSLIPKRNAAGEIDGLIGYFKNMTETKQANERIVAALAEKETLIREIHHRVKNNLQIISGLLDMTRMRTQDPATTSILTDMMMKIKTMAQIHTRLYESKQFDKINMGGHIRDQVADLSAIYGRSGPDITCTVDTGDFYLAVDQAIPCALVVNEALSNAFKHAFRGRSLGTIEVSARQDNGMIHISIQDDGTGIPEDVDINRATSLGLKLIRSLVMQLRGTLTIESTDRGSLVNVDIPSGTGG